MDYDTAIWTIYFWKSFTFFDIFSPICFICEATLDVLKGVLNKMYYYYYYYRSVCL